MSFVIQKEFDLSISTYFLTGNREEVFHKRSKSGELCVYSLYFCYRYTITKSQCHNCFSKRNFSPKNSVNCSFKKAHLFHFLCRWRVSQTENGSTSKVCTMTDSSGLWFDHNAFGLLHKLTITLTDILRSHFFHWICSKCKSLWTLFHLLFYKDWNLRHKKFNSTIIKLHLYIAVSASFYSQTFF